MIARNGVPGSQYIVFWWNYEAMSIHFVYDERIWSEYTHRNRRLLDVRYLSCDEELAFHQFLECRYFQYSIKRLMTKLAI